MNKRDKENKITKTVNKNNIIKISIRNIIAMFLVLFFILTGAVEARGEIVSDIIREKENKINEIMLKANEGITLTRTYTNGTESIDLKWSAVGNSNKYTIYQSKEGEEEKLITTVQDATSVTLNRANAGIKDEAAPTVPTVTATQNADGTGNNITIEASTDNGTTYRHRVETTVPSNIEYVDMFSVDATITGGHESSTERGIFVVPEGVTRIRVACVGGGGSDSTNGTHYGEDSYFGDVRATGGSNTSAGTPNGFYDNRRDGRGFAKSFERIIESVSSGYGSAYENYGGAHSGSGGYISTYIDVTPGQEIPWQAGRGAHKGGRGYVYIAFGGNIQPDTICNSNTISTTVTTGIKGYQYAITTSSTHTFTNEEIVDLADLPIYISGEQEMAQYLHIRAVDKAGNVSETRSVLLQVPAKITLTTNYTYGMNNVPLTWIINDKRPGYVYRLYQREDGQEKFSLISSSNSVDTVTAHENKTVSYTTPGNYTWTVPSGVTSIKVTIAGAGGGGGGGCHSAGWGNGYGGRGGHGALNIYTISVKENESYSMTVGAGGTGGEGGDNSGKCSAGWKTGRLPSGNNGGSSSFGSYTSAGGGGGQGILMDENGCTVGYPETGAAGTDGKGNSGNAGNGGYGGQGGNEAHGVLHRGGTGGNGYIYIEYERIIIEPLISELDTVDTSAKDKFAPAILELYLNGIKGDKTKYEIGMVSEDYGTTYEHYITGTNSNYNMKVTSNVVISEVITGIKGYSWKIDSNETGDADTTIGYDNDENKTTTFPTTISTDYLDKGYYLHARAVDNAGNWGATVHVKLETVTITLTSHYNEYTDSNGYGPNYVPLTWENSNQNEKFFYKLFQKNEDQSEWMQTSTNYGKTVRVLNVYPNVGNQLKGWMQNYGLGLITVDEVPITSFNANPNRYLMENGLYKYDVIMFGSWDTNNDYDLSWAAAQATEQFILTGRGVLFGHDTICDYGGMGHHNFNYLAKYVKATPTRNVARVGSSTVKVIKKGFLTKYPYDIETRNLTVPYCHTSGVLVYSDIWIKFLNLGGPLTDGPDIGNNNYYLASWNNCAFIRTGHSNGAATADEQKILANVLFYLGQVTEDTYANVYTAEDLAAPEVTDIKITDNKKENRLELDIEGIDYGSSYDHYVTGMKLLTAGNYYSNTVHTTVKTGIQKFQYTINNSPTEYSGTQYEVPAVNKETCEINIDKSYIGQYLHIRAVDNADNVGTITTIYLDGARTISREEKNETEELYCIEEDVLIPAEYDGTQSDATVEVAGNRETLRWPLNIQKLFELYKEDGVALRNPYSPNGQSGFVDKSNSLGRYLVSKVPGTQPR